MSIAYGVDLAMNSTGWRLGAIWPATETNCTTLALR